MTPQARCRATTRTGSQCKNRAQAGSPYCHVHGSRPEEAPVTAQNWVQDLDPQDRADFRRLAAELNAMAREIQSEDAAYRPPPFTLSGLFALVQANIDRFTPAAQRELLETLRASFQGTEPEDLVNPETWKGFWYVFHYMANHRKSELETRLNQRLQALPGFAFLTDVREGLQGASARDLLEPATWKGLYYVASYSARLQLNELKQRLLGEDEE